MKWILVVAGVLLATGTTWAQADTEPVQKRSDTGVIEEYFVLQADKKVRQGPYVKYSVMPGPRDMIALQEVGAYANGQKDGEWQVFTDRHHNRLASKGRYLGGLQEGQWVYYHRPKRGENGTIIYTSRNPKENVSFDVNDSTAVVRARGIYHRGQKISQWKYFDPGGQLVQAINESTNQLMYWRQDAGQAVSGEQSALNHPVLYVGGKEQLRWNIFESIDQIKLLNLDRTGTVEFVIDIDSLGRQQAVRVASTAAPTKYEAQLLPLFDHLPASWLPLVVDGKSLAGEYRVRIITTAESVEGKRGNRLRIELVGE